MSVNKSLKTAIQKVKNDLSLKQADVADKLGITSTYLSDMINGRVPLTDIVSNGLLEIFHIDIRTNTNDLKSDETHQLHGNYCKRCEQKDQTISELVIMLKGKENEIKQLRDTINYYKKGLDRLEGDVKKTTSG